jgi:predicted phosphodiesterase
MGMSYPYDVAQHGAGPIAGSELPVRRISVGSAAFVSDIHANTYAFEAVLADLEREPVDALVLTGDITWGTFPARTCDLIRAAQQRFRHVVLIRGNGDRAVLELADRVREPRRPREQWMFEAHRPADVELLHTALFQIDVEVAGLGVIRACHGSPRADIETITPGTPIERLAEATAGVEADLLLTGHTHLQFDRPLTGLPRIRRSVNPGSAGIPYGASERGAYWLRVDGGRLEFRRSDYDFDAYVAEMVAVGDPRADAVADLLRQPPSVEEITKECEELVFAD